MWKRFIELVANHMGRVMAIWCLEAGTECRAEEISSNFKTQKIESVIANLNQNWEKLRKQHQKLKDRKAMYEDIIESLPKLCIVWDPLFNKLWAHVFFFVGKKSNFDRKTSGNEAFFSSYNRKKAQQFVSEFFHFVAENESHFTSGSSQRVLHQCIGDHLCVI